MLEQLQQDQTPLSMDVHTEVLKHYKISTNHLAKEVANQITEGELTWQQFGGTHPKPYGNAIAATMIEGLLNHAWKGLEPDSSAIEPHGELPKPIDPLSYDQAKFVDPQTAKVKSGWQWMTPDWSSIPGGKRSRFTSTPMLVAESVGDELTLDFEGTTVGAYVVAGPDAGILEASIDGGDFVAVDLYHRYSKGLHYPRTVILATDLKATQHTLVLRISKQTKSAGHAARIIQFTVN